LLISFSVQIIYRIVHPTARHYHPNIITIFIISSSSRSRTTIITASLSKKSQVTSGWSEADRGLWAVGSQPKRDAVIDPVVGRRRYLTLVTSWHFLLPAPIQSTIIFKVFSGVSCWSDCQ